MASDMIQHHPDIELPAENVEVSTRSEGAPPWLNTRPSAVTKPALRLGYWAAAFATAFTIVFVVLAIAFESGEWSGIEGYARTFDSLQMVQLVPVLLLAPTVVVLITSIHTVASDTRRVFSMIAVVFSGVYAAIIATNYMIQLFVVRLNVLSNDLEGLSLLAMGNPNSVFVALETVGYGFFGLAMLSIGAVFKGELQAWISGLFITSGITGILGAVAAPLGQALLTLIGFSVSLLAFLAAAVLVGLFLRRLTRQLSTTT